MTLENSLVDGDEQQTLLPNDEVKTKRAYVKREDDPDLVNYFNEYVNESDGFEMKLNRLIRKPGQKKVTRSFLRRYIDEIPLEEDIGKEYGGEPGKNNYELYYYSVKERRPYTKTITIDESYGPGRVEREKQAAQESPVGYPAPVPAHQADPVSMMTVIMKEMVKPMLDVLVKPIAQQQAQPQQAMPDFGKAMEGVVNTMAKGVASIGTAMASKKVDEINQQFTPQPAATSPEEIKWAKEIFGLVKTFGQKFLENKEMNGDSLKGMMQTFMGVEPSAIPEQSMSLVYSLGCNDPDVGKEKMDRIFQKANFEVPQV